MNGHHVPRGVYSKQGKMTNCGGHMYLTRFFNDCDSSSGITNLRPTYGTIPILFENEYFLFQ